MYFDSYCRVVLEQRSEVPLCLALLLSEWGPTVHGRHALLRALLYRALYSLYIKLFIQRGVQQAQPQPRPSMLRRATSGPSGLC